jgi:hypothetical protein
VKLIQFLSNLTEKLSPTSVAPQEEVTTGAKSPEESQKTTENAILTSNEMPELKIQDTTTQPVGLYLKKMSR